MNELDLVIQQRLTKERDQAITRVSNLERIIEQLREEKELAWDTCTLYTDDRNELQERVDDALELMRRLRIDLHQLETFGEYQLQLLPEMLDTMQKAIVCLEEE